MYIQYIYIYYYCILIFCRCGAALDHAVLFNLPNFFKVTANLYVLCVSDYRHRFIMDFVTNMTSITFKSAGINL